MEKLTWTFPRLPEEPVQLEILFELRYPLSPNSIGAQCGENSVYVEVMEDFFGTGKLLMASGFALGGCGPIGQDNNARVLLFESELHGCGSSSNQKYELVYTFSLVYTPQEIVYTFSLVYTPQEISNGCHYPRMHNVSSNVLVPTWVPYAATKVAEERLVFSFKLMTGLYYTAFNASVKTYNHVPLCVFVDRCVATVSPDVNSAPRYSFIENNGCLVDAKFTGSSSRYLPRTQIDKLQFQLEAFRFQQIYITCILKAVPVWVCGCCDSTCSSSSASDQVLGDLRWEQASIGPLNF
ncbi:zona pellucida 3 [Triplophysa rosa]|uniref:Zona pellucida sperm-binding protein 3 n=1 Tax=Triplophysa rosa TaxID=992332 RepID=A0A9W7TMA2_TRIRA|nr:zona pellucida 3 [Triplophysa rosa]